MGLRKFFGHCLHFAQQGVRLPNRGSATNPPRSSRDGGSGVLKKVENDRDGTYRAVYTVKFAHGVFVLHCFNKKSKRGIETPKADMEMIHARLKMAEAIAKEW